MTRALQVVATLALVVTAAALASLAIDQHNQPSPARTAQLERLLAKQVAEARSANCIAKLNLLAEHTAAYEIRMWRVDNGASLKAACKDAP